MPTFASAAARNVPLPHDALRGEPISPELVLVDQELARAERSRLCERARVETLVDIATLHQATRAHAPAETPSDRTETLLGWTTTQLGRAACLTAVFGSGLLLALHVARGPAPVVKRAAPASASAEATPAPGPWTLKAMAEQRVISLVLGPARPKLPQHLIDSRTGLVKNNVQAVCHRRAGSAVFLCVVHPAMAAPNAGLYVRYLRKRDGREILQWQGYRQRLSRLTHSRG
jgi:hypothetical protein